MSGRYDLHVALDASDGVRRLRAEEFAAVVVDIRLPAGDDERWVKLHLDLFRNNKAARLGLKLLEIVLDGEEAPWRDTFRASMRDPLRYGVLSVENRSDLSGDLNRLGVKVYQDKGDGENDDILLKTIQSILTARGFK
jgi:hypothetical protein